MPQGGFECGIARQSVLVYQKKIEIPFIGLNIREFNCFYVLSFFYGPFWWKKLEESQHLWHMQLI